MADIIADLTESLRKPLTDRIKVEFTALAHRSASELVSSHFSKRKVTTANGTTTVTGPGYLELEEMLDKLFGSEKMRERMQKYFDDNFDRIFAATMDEAISHGIRKEIFSDARIMAGAKAAGTSTIL